MLRALGLVAALALAWWTGSSSSSSPSDVQSDDPLVKGAPCNIDVWRAGELSEARFAETYRERRPVVLRGGSPASREFVRRTAPEALLAAYENTTVVLSSGNAVSHGKRAASFRQYYEELMVPVTLDMKADRVWYKFGDHSGEELDAMGPLLDEYDVKGVPLVLPAEEVAVSFGIGNNGSGVPFHVHGAVWADLLHGHKRWFLYEPGARPPFDGNTTTLSWLAREYPTLPRDRRPMECVCAPGDILYIPSMFWHATLNVGKTVFLSSFVNNFEDF